MCWFCNYVFSVEIMNKKTKNTPDECKHLPVPYDEKRKENQQCVVRDVTCRHGKTGQGDAGHGEMGHGETGHRKTGRWDTGRRDIRRRRWQRLPPLCSLFRSESLSGASAVTGIPARLAQTFFRDSLLAAVLPARRKPPSGLSN